jgi:disulfide oxidoreductase YuzD
MKTFSANKIILFSVLLTILCSCRSAREPNSNSSDTKDYAGFIGVYYNKVDLTYPKGVIMLDSLTQFWEDNENYKSGSGAVWVGYLESPYTGKVILQLESSVIAILKINDIVMQIGEGGENSVEQVFEMKKGHKYPVELTFINIHNDALSGRFEVNWRWADHEFELVVKKYLSHTREQKQDLSWLTDLDENKLESGNYLRAANAEHVVVHYEPGRIAGWPANYGIWSWGDEILVSFSQGYYKEKPHQHSIDESKPGKRAFARSLDGGETWSLEDTDVYPEVQQPHANLGEKINFTNPGFVFTSNGDRFNVSYDKGKTWGIPYTYPDFNKDFDSHSARTDYLVIDEKTCRIFIASQYVGEKGWAQDMAYMIETRDGGKTLDFINWIAETDSVRSVMPSTIKISNDHMITALRRRYNTPKEVNHSLRYNWIDVYETTDGGRSWQFLNKIADTDDGRRNGNPPALVRLNDGTLVVAYGYRGIPYSIRARTSTDTGKSWSKEIIIREDAIKWDIGYVRMVTRPDDKVVLVYYYTTEDRKELHVEATIWDPNDVTDY